MSLQSEEVAHAALVGGVDTALHSHSGGGGGATIKAGSTTTDGSGIATITFGAEYSDTNYSILMTAQDPGDTVIPMYNSKATTGFGIVSMNDQGNSEPNVTIDWMAVHL